MRRRRGHGDGWEESLPTSCGGEGEKLVGREGLNKVPTEDLFDWSEGKWKMPGGEERIREAGRGPGTTRKEAKTAGPRGRPDSEDDLV